MGHELPGRALALQGMIDPAVARFERALQIDPAYPAARENLDRLLRATGRAP